MKVLQATLRIDPAGGGVVSAVKGYCRALDLAGIDITLLVTSGHDDFPDRGRVRVVYGTPVDIAGFDLVHIHGLWTPALHRVARDCRVKGVPYVVSPHGMLDPWALGVKKWKKRLAMALYQRRDLEGAAAFHVTAAPEERSVRAQGLSQPCFVVPNGVALPREMPPRMAGGDGCRTAIFVSRLHPGKGLLTLAEAWARVRPAGWVMKVAGPDSYRHQAEVVARLETLGIRDQWQFAGMLDDEEKWKAYRSADLLVHPSVSENFGITVAEGLAAGLPALATKGAPWGELASERCGWWIDVGVEPLAAALREATTMDDAARAVMGARGRALVEAKYLWPGIGRAMAAAYENILRV